MQIEDMGWKSSGFTAVLTATNASVNAPMTPAVVPGSTDSPARGEDLGKCLLAIRMGGANVVSVHFANGTGVAATLSNGIPFTRNTERVVMVPALAGPTPYVAAIADTGTAYVYANFGNGS